MNWLKKIRRSLQEKLLSIGIGNWHFLGTCRSYYWSSSVLESLCKVVSLHDRRQRWKLQELKFISNCQPMRMKWRISSWQLMKHWLIIMIQKWSIRPWNIITNLHKAQASIGPLMFIIFWNADGVIHMAFLEPGTISSQSVILQHSTFWNKD